jgi:hypothetical protein
MRISISGAFEKLEEADWMAAGNVVILQKGN